MQLFTTILTSSSDILQYGIEFNLGRLFFDCVVLVCPQQKLDLPFLGRKGENLCFFGRRKTQGDAAIIGVKVASAG